MTNRDPLEEKFRNAFSEFERTPPDQVWQNLRQELHPEPATGKRKLNIFKGAGQAKRLYIYFSLAAASVLLFFLVVYFSSFGHHAIRGFAYAGDARLCKGTAILFIVEDKALPRDSVVHYRSAVIDQNGFYQFKGVQSGNYLLRVVPEQTAAGPSGYLPSWYEQHESHHDAHLIGVESEDVKADVHLIKDDR